MKTSITTQHTNNITKKKNIFSDYCKKTSFAIVFTLLNMQFNTGNTENKQIIINNTQSLIQEIYITKQQQKKEQEKEIFYEQQLLKITNIDKLDSTQQANILERIRYRETTLDSIGVPKEMRIPLEAVCVSRNKKEIHIITKFKNIHYLPNIDFAYQLSLINYENTKKYGENNPLITICLGLFSQETGIRDIEGDKGNSKGYGQVHKNTAKYLLKSKRKNIYEQYFYIDKDKSTQKENLFFHGNTYTQQQENMIRTTPDILVLEKGYKKNNEAIGLARYNGSQKNLKKYALPVIEKALKYAIFFSAINNKQFEYESLLEQVIKQEKKNNKKDIEIFKDLFQQQITEIKIWRENTDKKKKNINTIDKNTPIQMKNYFTYSNVSIPEVVEGYPYIIPEEDKTIFSYFRENTREAIQYHNSINKDPKGKIEIFYYELIKGKREKKIINSKGEMIQKSKQGYMIYTTPYLKRIYVKPGTELYYYEGSEDRVTTINIADEEDLKSIQQQIDK